MRTTVLMQHFLNLLDQGFSLDCIVANLLLRILDRHDIGLKDILNDDLRNFLTTNTQEHLPLLDVEEYSLYDISSFIELSMGDDEKTKNGIVFTPKYICDFIVADALRNYVPGQKILDPACGCGNFLFSTLDFLRNNGYQLDDVLKNTVFAYDINPIFVKYANLLCILYVLLDNPNIKDIKTNIKAGDFLSDVNETKYDYIIGNPPYINNHDLSDRQISFLKSNYETTTTGTFNIFYAFIEKGINHLTDEGSLEFIIPNNFMYIKSAEPLRAFLSNGVYVDTIIDFRDNTIFSPALTYNCILKLNRRQKTTVRCAQINKTNNIVGSLCNISYEEIQLRGLRQSVWELTSDADQERLRKIESFDTKLGDYIKVGIATLKDKVYILDGFDSSKEMYYKCVNDKKFYIETGTVLPFIKVSKYACPDDMMYIIFPYTIEDGKTIPLDEDVLRQKYPLTYKYLENQKTLLDSRNSPRAPMISPWYSYGRSQGLSNWGDKIYFSTFSEKPNFRRINGNKCLYANGYSISNTPIEYHILEKILNSSIMEFYIEKTSYTISGNYKCYQKKYLKNFSVPPLSSEDIEYIENHNDEELNCYLEKLYYYS